MPLSRKLASGVRPIAKTAFAVVDSLMPAVTGPRILVYHQVGAGHGYQLDVGLATFRRHLETLRSYGEIVSLEDSLARAGEPGAEELVVLTFDDGYSDMFANAFPLLSRGGIPFTVYLSSGAIESRVPLSLRPSSDPISWSQVNRMLETGLMTLGSHTHSHADLRHLAPAQIGAELDRCDELIEARTGVRPLHFAFPWGYSSESAVQEVRRRYDTAVVGGSTRRSPVSDPHAVPRIPIQLSDGLVFFRRKCQRGLRTEEWTRRLITGYRGP